MYPVVVTRGVKTLFLGMLLSLVPLAHAEQNENQEITASDGFSGNRFGRATALAGDWAMVGADADDENGAHAGAVYAFRRINGVFVEQQKLMASDAASGDGFGSSVAMDGAYAVVGASSNDDNGNESGSAYVFTLLDGQWAETAKLLPSDGASEARFGAAVAISGQTIVVGAPYDSERAVYGGKAYFFERVGGVWEEAARFPTRTANAEDYFGNALAVEGNTAIVGAPSAVMPFGHAYVYSRVNGTWLYTTDLMPDEGEGPSFLGYGSAVAIRGNAAVVSSPYEFQGNLPTESRGGVYVFSFDGTAWSYVTRLQPNADGLDNVRVEYVGESVALSDRMLVIGAASIPQSGGSLLGAAYVYTSVDAVWSPVTKLTTETVPSGFQFARALAARGATVLAGAPGAGTAYLFAVEGLPALARGDVNGDLKIDAADIQSLVNALLGASTPEGNGDLTGDSKIDAADIQAMINLVLG